jgi:hypothetical protein
LDFRFNANHIKKIGDKRNKFLENFENVQRALAFESVQDLDKLFASVLYGELFLHKHFLVKYSGSMENIGTSHERMPLMSLGSCTPASLPYVQSRRDSIIGGVTNW